MTGRATGCRRSRSPAGLFARAPNEPEEAESDPSLVGRRVGSLAKEQGVFERCPFRSGELVGHVDPHLLDEVRKGCERQLGLAERRSRAENRCLRGTHALHCRAPENRLSDQLRPRLRAQRSSPSLRKRKRSIASSSASRPTSSGFRMTTASNSDARSVVSICCPVTCQSLGRASLVNRAELCA